MIFIPPCSHVIARRCHCKCLEREAAGEGFSMAGLACSAGKWPQPWLLCCDGPFTQLDFCPATHSSPLQHVPAQANSGKILAPIRAAEARLEQAAEMIDSAASPQAYMPVLQAVRASSLNCCESIWHKGWCAVCWPCLMPMAHDVLRLPLPGTHADVFESRAEDTIETRASLMTQQMSIADPWCAPATP